MTDGRPLAGQDVDVHTLHASCVALDGLGVLLLGASGSGKSGLALQLMAFGADLVADDQTMLTAAQGALHAAAPPPLTGLIEARGIGLLNAGSAPTARVVLAIDLDSSETARLPQRHTKTIVGVTLPCLHKVDSPYFPAAILQYLKAGRRDLS